MMAKNTSICLFIYLMSLLLASSSGSLERATKIRGQRIAGLFVEVSLKKDSNKKEFVREEGQIVHRYQRQLLSNLNTKSSQQHDLVYPPTTTFPTTPVTNPVTTPTFNPVTAPVTVPPDNAAPGIVTVPGMNPVTVTPMPPSTPVPQPNTDPINSPLPVTNPVTTPSTNPGTQPVTNPVTTYPAPTTGVPVTTPVTTPVIPPATGNGPALPGQSWCVAKSGAPQTTLQSALDYACGTGVADCSVIQQSGSCYNPNTLQNHASYAFNSYYQKKPAQTSCDFGGAATLTNTNPSAGSCIYPSSSSSTSSLPPPVSPTPVSPVPESPIPQTPMPETPPPETPTPSTAANGGGAIPGSGSPPAAPTTSIPQPSAPIGFGDIPPSAFGESPPPSMNSTTAMSTRVQPFIGCVILVTSIITGKFVLNI
uniref:X8 domain-containing protein n=2 Tax=Daucus carota subsp. sativus TaxID=79200 RepID=A0A166CW35_DAUCS